MKIYETLCTVCKGHSKYTSLHASDIFYVIDRTKSSSGEVEIHEQEPDLKGVIISNPNHIEVYFDSFPKNAFKIKTGSYKKQCEGVMFPASAEEDEWLLFIETKYAPDLIHAQKPQANYIEVATAQIKAVVEHFRLKGILKPDKKVHAIISFPLIDDTFDSWAFIGAKENMDDLLATYGIIIRCTNKATIFDNRLLFLGI